MSTDELAWFKSSYSGGGGDNCVEIAWTKSSYSGDSGDNCVEVGWLKSSHSGGDGDNCVEVAAHPAAILVRDSKDIARQPLALSRQAWSAFTAYAQA
ncbi:DUF397 domain-containing protein [Streptomyces bambusae]|uniref:DUF397 domain-containing protein n=1 Tax=Streptomyces bambusae TaxID=1550616 RepID=A0ABS6ZCR3_9ACTN|nr:DUF397 domain-containing protein [Streptomyces bambusae]MBW5485548.1 DUF397 domain-containing protein [Streptomyces bambusae]